MSEGRVLQRLLSSGEYDELEDIVIVEGQFVEVDEVGIASRQVILGLTPEVLLMAEHVIVNYKKDPHVFYDTDVDPLLYGLEISSVFHVCLMELTVSRRAYGLIMKCHGRKRYFEMTNTRMNGDIEDLWYQWVDRVNYLHEDPYRYIRNMFDLYNLPYPRYLRDIDEQDKLQQDLTVVNIPVKMSVTSKRKGSRYIKGSAVDVTDYKLREDIFENRLIKKRTTKLCCSGNDDDDDVK